MGFPSRFLITARGQMAHSIVTRSVSEDRSYAPRLRFGSLSESTAYSITAKPEDIVREIIKKASHRNSVTRYGNQQFDLRGSRSSALSGREGVYGCFTERRRTVSGPGLRELGPAFGTPRWSVPNSLHDCFPAKDSLNPDTVQ